MKNKLKEKKIAIIGAIVMAVILILVCVIVRCSGDKEISDTTNNQGIEIDQVEDQDFVLDESETILTDDEVDYAESFEGGDDTARDDVEDDSETEPNEDGNFDVSDDTSSGFGVMF